MGQPIFNRPAAWFGMVPAWIFEYADQVGAEGIAIFAALCCHANKEKRCFPSQERLKKETGCSEQTVRRRLKQLTDLGLIMVITKGNGRGKATLYEITDFLQRVPQGHPLSGGGHLVDNSTNGATGEEKGYQGGAKRVPQGHPNIPNEQTHITKSDLIVDKSSRPDRPESIGDIIKRRRPKP